MDRIVAQGALPSGLGLPGLTEVGEQGNVGRHRLTGIGACLTDELGTLRVLEIDLDAALLGPVGEV